MELPLFFNCLFRKEDEYEQRNEHFQYDGI